MGLKCGGTGNELQMIILRHIHGPYQRFTFDLINQNGF